MLNIRTILLSWWILILFLIGCAGTYQSKLKENPTIFDVKIGTATAYDIKENAYRIFDRYHYQIVRFEETYDEIYIETQWHYRTPFEDEYNQGVVNAKTRIIIITNPRTRSYAGAADLHVVHVRGENQVRLADKDNWITLPMSDMLINYLKKFTEDLKTELSMGIRKF